MVEKVIFRLVGEAHSISGRRAKTGMLDGACSFGVAPVPRSLTFGDPTDKNAEFVLYLSPGEASWFFTDALCSSTLPNVLWLVFIAEGTHV